MREDPPFHGDLMRRGLPLASRRSTPRPPRDRGQALIEMALVLPLILLLDFGRAYNYKNNISDLANQAARYAEVNGCNPCSSGQTLDGDPGSPSTSSYIKTLADSDELENGGGGTLGIESPGVTVSFCFPSGGTPGAQGNSVKVTVTATYKWLPYFHFGDTTISASVTTRIATAWTSGGANVYLKGGAGSPCT
jgi:hypothetical protein